LVRPLAEQSEGVPDWGALVLPSVVSRAGQLEKQQLVQATIRPEVKVGEHLGHMDKPRDTTLVAPDN
jgi:hypothetical protein